MRRRPLFLLVLVAVAVILAAAGLVFSAMQRNGRRAPLQNGAPAPVEPLNKEMACVDRVLNSTIEANQVQAALDACR